MGVETDELKYLAGHGAMFCRVRAHEKAAFEPGWQNKPYGLGGILPYLEHGENIGMLCGAPSGGLCLLDVDRDFEGFLSNFPDLSNAARVVRDGADKAKVLVKVIGDLPNGKKWKRQGEKSPFLEFLSTGNQGVIPPSTHPEGMPYRLEKLGGIIELPAGQLSQICRLWTGQDGLEPPDKDDIEVIKPAPRKYQPGNGDDLKDRVLEFWTPLKVFSHFGMAADAVKDKQYDWIRLKGNGGLLVNKDGLSWVLAGSRGIGGDAISAWLYAQSGSCKTPHGREFMQLLENMADAAGLPRNNGHKHMEKTQLETPQVIFYNPEMEQAKEELDLLSFEFDHKGHARAVMAMNPGRIAYCDAWGWLWYDGLKWTRENAKQIIGLAVEETLRARKAAARQAENEQLEKICKCNSGMVAGVRDRLQDACVVAVDEFDNDPNALNVANGVVDLRTGVLSPHSSYKKFTYVIDTPYYADVDFNPWVQHLTETTGSVELVDYLQLAVGYSLTGHTVEEVLFYIFGPARSGKGTFTEAILKLLGHPLATETDFATFTAERLHDTQSFDMAPLKPCRFVAASESNRNTPLNPAKIKALTGGNRVWCAFKYQDMFSYRPQFKIWLSSNYPVNGDVDDDALWGRIRVIHFPNSHLDEENKTLKARIQSPEYLRLILAWAIEGAIKWYRLWESGKGLPTPAAIKTATRQQREEQDFILMYLQQRTRPQQDGFVSTQNLHADYQRWCEREGVPAKFQKQFIASIKTKGYEAKQKRTISGTSPVRGVSGLVLLPED
jgi:putative DNA primase/helicase